MDLLTFFEWCEQTAIGETIRNSTWLFPVIEAFHLLGLGVTGGAVLLVDLRLLGVGLVRTPVAQLSAAAEPWLLGSVTLDVRLGHSLVLVRSDQVLLQPSVLGEDDVAVPGAHLYLHGSPLRDAIGCRRRSAAVGPIYGARLAVPVGRRGVGRTLDRVFRIG